MVCDYYIFTLTSVTGFRKEFGTVPPSVLPLSPGTIRTGRRDVVYGNPEAPTHVRRPAPLRPASRTPPTLRPAALAGCSAPPAAGAGTSALPAWKRRRGTGGGSSFPYRRASIGLRHGRVPGEGSYRGCGRCCGPGPPPPERLFPSCVLSLWRGSGPGG